MSIIDRYVIRQVLTPFVLGLLVFTFIFIIPELMRIAEELVARGVEAAVVAQLAFLLIPYALSLTIPMSLLLALLIAFGRLSADREFVAMQACGVSLLRLLRPVGVIAIGGWAATTYVLVVAVPEANQAFRQITFNVTAQRAEGEVKPRVFFDQFPDMVLYVREVGSQGWRGVFLADLRQAPRSAVYLAEHGRVVVDQENQRIDMVLENATQHTTDGAGEYDVGQFKRLVLGLNPSALLNRTIEKGLNEMTIAELRTAIEEKRRLIDQTTGQPFSTHNEEMAIHQKFSIPVACLVFGLIGLALGATNRRDGMLGSFVLGIFVIFAYYVPLYLGPSMVKAGVLPVWLGKWLPNVVLGIVGILLFVWRDRVADQPITLKMPAWLARREARGTASIAAGGRLRILDRYVSASYARILALAVVALVGIFYLTTFLQLSDKVFKGDATWAMLGQYFWYATPQWLYYVVPISVLLAVLVTLALLTKNSELIVMKACGISLYRIALPMIAVAAAAGALLFAMEETVLGTANRRAEEIRHVIRGGSPDTFDVLHRRWLVGTEGEIYHYIWYDPVKHLISGLNVYEFAGAMERITRRSYIDLATYTPGGEEDPLDMWRVERGWTREFHENGKVRSFVPFTASTARLETTSYFGTEQPNPDFMGYTELREHAQQLAASGFDIVRQEVAIARKLAFPFVTIVMTLLAVPFGVSIGRSGAMGGIGVGIALAITYWGVISVFAALGTGGALPPVLAAWAPNLLFGSAAAYMLLTVRT